jgi:hypothetical protein
LIATKRATTTGMVISGYGLSAFFFSCLRPPTTSAFLLLLSFGTSLPMIIGSFLVRPIPLPAYEIIGSAECNTIDDAYIDASAIFQHNDESRVLLLSNMAEEQPTSPSFPHDHDEPSLLRNSAPTPSELSSPLSSPPEDRLHHSRNNEHQSAFRSATHETLPNIHGIQLWQSSNFWMASVILSLRGYFSL